MAEKKKRTLASIMRESASRAKGSDPYSAGAAGGGAAKKATPKKKASKGKVYSKDEIKKGVSIEDYRKEYPKKKKKKVYSKDEIKRGVTIEEYRKSNPKKKSPGTIVGESMAKAMDKSVGSLKTKKASNVSSGKSEGSLATSRKRVPLTRKDKRRKRRGK